MSEKLYSDNGNLPPGYEDPADRKRGYERRYRRSPEEEADWEKKRYEWENDPELIKARAQIIKRLDYDND